MWNHLDSVGTKFYIILEGSVTVLVRKPNQTEMEAVRTLNKGDSFGELALIHK
jgi:CRP-like cAMP-binding protein